MKTIKENNVTVSTSIEYVLRNDKSKPVDLLFTSENVDEHIDLHTLLSNNSDCKVSPKSDDKFKEIMKSGSRASTYLDGLVNKQFNDFFAK